MAMRIPGKTAGPAKADESAEQRERIAGHLARWAPSLPVPPQGETTERPA